MQIDCRTAVKRLAKAASGLGFAFWRKVFLEMPLTKCLPAWDEDEAYVVSLPDSGDLVHTHGATYEEALQRGKELIEGQCRLSAGARRTVAATPHVLRSL